MSTLDWIKNKLMGSSTMPAGTGTGHEHKAGGGCCGGGHGDHHHHAHAHAHDHHDHGDSCCSGLDHDDQEEDSTTPKGGCC